ncbi:hypothetical protein ZIOFF_001944 [Zingiber officinale]|uniref:hAT-like transposase RNase-H fold domain-containing protein n=1 Tax=Zingiber officinale TaxID=94328 RepID=A0A8J5LVG2_ZINOF|nr:hypothetical protein ZIOFF_001944 [Zingiber officinale]
MSVEESSIPLTINSAIAESNEVNLEINKEIVTTGQETQEHAKEKEEEGFKIKKRKKFQKCGMILTQWMDQRKSNVNIVNPFLHWFREESVLDGCRLWVVGEDDVRDLRTVFFVVPQFRKESVLDGCRLWVVGEDDVRDLRTGSEYPTSNLFLQKVQKIKSALDTYSQYEDLFLKQLTSKMKEKFDKYWGDCNLLMAIATVLDPTKKILAVEFCFPKLYSELDASKHTSKVKEIINSLYEKYVVEETNKGAPHPFESESFGSSSVKRNQQSSMYSWDDFDDYCAKVETSKTKRSELADYLEKGHLKKNEIPNIFFVFRMVEDE